MPLCLSNLDVDITNDLTTLQFHLEISGMQQNSPDIAIPRMNQPVISVFVAGKYAPNELKHKVKPLIQMLL